MSADKLKELLLIAKNTDYMWYYDDDNIHQQLIVLLHNMKGKAMKCEYCGCKFFEYIKSCPQCEEWIVYEDLLKGIE